MPVKNLILRVGADVSNLTKQLDKARKEMTGFNNFVKGQMKGMSLALGGAALTMGIGQALQDAIKVEGAMEQVKRLMGESSQEFIKFADTSAISLGMSKAEALDYGRTYANLTSIFTKSTEETMKTTKELMEASAIISSATGRTMEDVMFRIRSGLLGNTEAVEDLGVTVYINMIEASEAMKKFANGKSWNQLDFKLQQQIRHYAILEQVHKKFGDEIYKNTGFRLNQFTASLKDLRLALGEAFLPILNVALPYLTSFTRKLVIVMNAVATFTRTLFGVSKADAAIIDVGDSVTGVGDDFKDAKKQAQGFLAGFDEINNIPKVQIGNVDGLDGQNVDKGGLPGFDPKKFNEDTKQFKEELDEINKKAKELAEAFRPTFSEFGEDMKFVYEKILKPFALWFAEGFPEAAIMFGKAFKNLPAVKGISDSFDTLKETLFDESWRSAVGKNAKTAWDWIKEQFSGSNAFFTMLFGLGGASLISPETKEKIENGAKDAWGWVKEQFTDSKSFFKNSFASIGAALIDPEVAKGITDGAKKAWHNIKAVFVDDKLGISAWFKSNFALIGQELTNAGTAIKKAADSLWATIKGAFVEVGTWFDKNVADPMSTSLSKIGTSLVEVVTSGLKTTINKFIDSLNTAFQLFNKFKNAVPFFKNTITDLPKIPKLARGGIVDSPTMAMVGEAGSEMVVPLENTSFVDKVASALGSAVTTAMQMSSNNNNRADNRDVVIKLDGNVLARAINPYTTKESGRIGTSIISIT